MSATTSVDRAMGDGRRAPFKNKRRRSPGADRGADMPSEDSFALAFVANHGDDYRYVAPWHRWIKWDGKRWREDSTGHVYERIRELVRATVQGDAKAERSTATASFVAGVERLLRTDQRIVVLPEQLDADPWALNTQSGIVDLRTGQQRPHDRTALCTRVTTAAVDASVGSELWHQFMVDITLGDAGLASYLQRVAGYACTGVTTEDVLVYAFGIGSNAKSSWAEAIVHALGDYARIFAPEVLMEAKGERHPTDLAQFMGVRLALTSEPSSNATWNDSRIKSLTGDAEISARFMRGDFFTFKRTHKTLVIGNHMPRLADVTHAIRRRVQMVPFRAVFQPTPGPGMRERIKAEASGALLAWIVEGARMWLAEGTAPPQCVRDLTTTYLSDEDEVGQWLAECCERQASASTQSSALHRSYSAWCERQGSRPKTNKALSAYLISAGFERRATMLGKMFHGLTLKDAP